MRLVCGWSGRSSTGGLRVCDPSPDESPALVVGRADDGDVLGRRFLLEGVVEVAVSRPHVGFSGGNPRSLMGSGEGGALLRRLPLGASPWMFRRPVGPVESGWLAAASSRLRLGGARPWGRRGCRSGGSGFRLRRVALRPWSADFGRVDVMVVGSFWSAALGLAWMPERRLRMLRLRCDASRSPPPCCVEVVWCRLMSLGRLGRRPVWSAASGPAWIELCFFFFLGLVPHVCFYFINIKAKLLPRFKKKKKNA